MYNYIAIIYSVLFKRYLHEKKRRHALSRADMLYTIVPFIMVKRSDACNALTVHLPYNSMHDYIAAKRAQGVNLSYMTLLSPLMAHRGKISRA